MHLHSYCHIHVKQFHHKRKISQSTKRTINNLFHKLTCIEASDREQQVDLSSDSTNPRSMIENRSDRKLPRLDVTFEAARLSLPLRLITSLVSAFTRVDTSSQNCGEKRPLRGVSSRLYSARVTTIERTISSRKNQACVIASSRAWPVDTTQCRASSSWSIRRVEGLLMRWKRLVIVGIR